MEFNLVVCIDNNGGIAKDGDIPWKIQEDSDYFRDLIKTKVNGKPNVIVSGRKTYEKMGLIKDFYNVVFTRDVIGNDSIIQVHNMEEFFSELADLDYGKIFICGGSEIYELFTNLIDNNDHKVNLYLNLINHNFECDTKISSGLIKYCHTIALYKNISTTMLVENKKDNKYYEFIHFNPVQLKLDSVNIIETKNKEEQKYLDVMTELLINGTKTETRNGITYSKFGTTLEFDLRNGYPLLTTKKMFFKGVCEELLFFLRGDCNSKHLSDKGIKIWEKNTDRTFLDSNGFTSRQEGDMGPMYGFQWRHFNAKYDGCDSDYNGKGLDQLSYVLKELKSNPHSRRIIMTTYNPLQASEGVLFPCHGISIQFHVEETNGEYVVNLSQNQRSADYFLGLPFNIASYGLLLHMISKEVNMMPDELIFSGGDCHIYLNHIDGIRKQLTQNTYNLPRIEISDKSIFDITFEDIKLIGYESSGKIDLPLSN